MSELHSLLTANHRPYAGVYADSTGRLAATGFVRQLGGGVVAFTAEDLYKEGLQLDNASTWALTNHSPVTWEQTGGPGLPPAAHGASHQNGGSDEVSVAGLSGVLADAQIADKVKESSGPATLTVGTVADGEYLRRSGSNLISGVPSGTGAETGANSDITSMDGLTGALENPTKIVFPEAAAPATPGANKVVLYAKTDGLLYSKDDAGVESGLAGGGGTPGGSDKQIQYNDSGAFGGVSDLTFDETTRILQLSSSNNARIGWSNSAGTIAFGGLGPGAVGTIKVTSDGTVAGTIYSPLTTMTDVGGNPRPFLGLAGQVQEFAMTTNRSMGQVGTDGGTAAKDGTFFTTIFVQDATGSRLLTWHASYKFPGGTSIPLSTAANALDIFTWLVRNGGSEAHLVYHSLDSR